MGELTLISEYQYFLANLLPNFVEKSVRKICRCHWPVTRVTQFFSHVSLRNTYIMFFSTCRRLGRTHYCTKNLGLGNFSVRQAYIRFVAQETSMRKLFFTSTRVSYHFKA